MIRDQEKSNLSLARSLCQLLRSMGGMEEDDYNYPVADDYDQEAYQVL